MKIAYCAHSKVPSREANSIHVMKMCQALAKQGHDIELLVPDMQTESGNPYDYYGVENIFTITHIKWPKIKFGVLLYSYRVLRHIKKMDNGVVYGRDLTTCFFAAMSGIPTIWESHSPVEYMGSPFTSFFKLMKKKASLLKIVVIASTLKQYYIEKHGVSPDMIEILPDCSDPVDLEKVTPAQLDNKGCKASIGYIGQLYSGKGMEILSQLIPLCPDVMFHIIGGNDKDINRWREALKENRNVYFYGFMKPSDTIAYGLAMDILIAPYMRKVQGAGSKQFEGDLSNWMSPLKLFEYMSYRKPIIATDLPVLHDVLNEKNSIVCNPDIINEWVDAINLIINSPETANRLAERAFKDFNEKYTWSIRAKRIVSLYKNRISN